MARGDDTGGSSTAKDCCASRVTTATTTNIGSGRENSTEWLPDGASDAKTTPAMHGQANDLSWVGQKGLRRAQQERKYECSISPHANMRAKVDAAMTAESVSAGVRAEGGMSLSSAAAAAATAAVAGLSEPSRHVGFTGVGVASHAPHGAAPPPSCGDLCCGDEALLPMVAATGLGAAAGLTTRTGGTDASPPLSSADTLRQLGDGGDGGSGGKTAALTATALTPRVASPSRPSSSTAAAGRVGVTAAGAARSLVVGVGAGATAPRTPIPARVAASRAPAFSRILRRRRSARDSTSVCMTNDCTLQQRSSELSLCSSVCVCACVCSCAW
jgi:hypothetical protein